LLSTDEFETLSNPVEELNVKDLTTPVSNGDKLTIKVPIVYGPSSSIYLGSSNPSIWQPNVATDASKEYLVYSDKGMVQKVTGQYQNQYENILQTKTNEKYLWVWEGENISNVVSTLCLTYSGDDKCWLSDFFYNGMDKTVARLFTASPEYTRLNASYSSMSHKSSTMNVLKKFIVMKFPSQWEDYRLHSSSETSYSTKEASSFGTKLSSLGYVFKLSGESHQNTLLTIPQAKSEGWVAVTNYWNILKDDVTVNGWKQGWDISNTDFNTIYIFYWPNLLGYLGYILIVVEFTYLLIKVFRKRKHAKQ
jgi:hypothetical protein